MYISGSRCICRVGPLLSLLDSLTEIATDLNFPRRLEGSLVVKVNTALRALDDVNEKNDTPKLDPGPVIQKPLDIIKNDVRVDRFLQIGIRTQIPRFLLVEVKFFGADDNNRRVRVFPWGS